jgi:hypothetical protein
MEEVEKWKKWKSGEVQPAHSCDVAADSGAGQFGVRGEAPQIARRRVS